MKKEYVQIIIERDSSQNTVLENPITISQSLFGGRIIRAEILQDIPEIEKSLDVLNEN